MNFVTRIVVIGCAGLFMGTTAAATVDWAMPTKAMLAGGVASVIWLLLGTCGVRARSVNKGGAVGDDAAAQ